MSSTGQDESNFQRIKRVYEESENSLSDWSNAILFHAKVQAIGNANSEDGAARSFPLAAILQKEQDILKHTDDHKIEVLTAIYHAHKKFAVGAIDVDEDFSKAVNAMIDDSSNNLYKKFLNGSGVEIDGGKKFSIEELSLPATYVDESKVFFDTVKDSTSQFLLNEFKSSGFDSYFLFKEKHSTPLKNTLDSLDGVDFARHKNVLYDMINDSESDFEIDLKKKKGEEGSGNLKTQFQERAQALLDLGLSEDILKPFDVQKNGKVKFSKQDILKIVDAIDCLDLDSKDRGLKTFFSLLNLGKNRIGLKPARIMGVEGGLFFANLVKGCYQKNNKDGIFDKISRESQHGSVSDNGISIIRSQYRGNSADGSAKSAVKNIISSIVAPFTGVKNMKNKLAGSIGSSTTSILIAAGTIVFAALLAAAAIFFPPTVMIAAASAAIACVAVYGGIGRLLSYFGGKKSADIADGTVKKFKSIELSTQLNDKENGLDDKKKDAGKQIVPLVENKSSFNQQSVSTTTNTTHFMDESNVKTNEKIHNIQNSPLSIKRKKANTNQTIKEDYQVNPKRTVYSNPYTEINNESIGGYDSFVKGIQKSFESDKSRREGLDLKNENLYQSLLSKDKNSSKLTTVY